MSLCDEQFYHQCELVEEDDEDYYYNKSWKKLINIYSVNENLAVTQQYLKSKALMREEKRRHLTHFPFTIHPFSTLTLVWDSFMIIILTIAYIRLPFMFFDYLKNEYGSGSPVDLDILFATNCFYLVNIIFRLFQGVVKEEQNVWKVELHLGRCFLIYLKESFVFDILSTVPFLIVRFYDSDSDSNSGFLSESNVKSLWRPTFRFMSLLRLARLYDYQTYIRRFLEYSKVKDNDIDIVLLFTVSLIIFHQFIGLQLLPGIIAIKFFNATEFQQNNEKKFWYEAANFKTSNMSSQFIICTYRAVSTLFGTGFTEFQPRNVYDNCFLSFMCAFGCIARCILFVKFLEKLKSMQYHRYKYEEIMNQIHRYVRHKKLPQKVHDKFRKFYDFHYRGSYFPEVKVERCVPELLKQDILLHNTRVLTEKVSFFANLPSAVFQTIVARLHREVVLEGEIVVGCGEIGDSMYFIASGSLVQISPSGIELGHVSDGQFFGIASLVMEHNRRVISCIALETCELYRLDREDFNRVILPNPSLLHEIEKTATERYDYMRFVEEQFRRRTNTPEAFEVYPVPSDTDYDGLIRSPWVSSLHNRRSTMAGSQISKHK